MKHRATARRRFLIAESTNDLPPAGTPVLAGTRELGQLGSGKCGRALALIRLDRLDEATRAGEPITAAGRSVGLRKPDWLRL